MYLRIFVLGIISLMSLTIFSNELVNAEPSNKIPPWTKILGDWWLEERISDMEFIQSLTFMTNSGIIKIIENESKEIDIFDSISKLVIPVRDATFVDIVSVLFDVTNVECPPKINSFEGIFENQEYENVSTPSKNTLVVFELIYI